MEFLQTFPDEYPSLQAYTKGVKKAERVIVGRDAEMEQVLAAMMRPELCNVILLAEAGSGKAHANGTPIPVADDRGYVPIEQLSPGDLVFGRDGAPVQVLGVYPQGKLPAYEVLFSDGSRLVCNDEHLFAVRTAVERYHGKEYQNRTLRELLSEGSSVWYVPHNGAVIRPNAEVPIPGYLAGLLLSSDGSYDPIGDLFCLCVTRDGLSKRLRLLCDQENVVYYEVSCDHAVYFLFPHLLEKGTDVWFSFAFQVCVPDCYLFADKNTRRDVLSGFLDGCGQPSLPRKYDVMLEFTTQRMADSVKELADSLGIRSIRADGYLCPRLVFQVSDEEKPELFTLDAFRDKMKDALWGKQTKVPRYDNGLQIVSIMDLGYSCEMTCIYVNSPDHLYQAGKCHVVTHNTALVQGTMLKDPNRIYLEVDLSKMISDLSDPNQMADRLKTLFAEVQAYSEAEEQEIVLFMDEFHQVVQLSAAAVEALKPLLADSGTRGIRVIAATTYREFREFISPNQPLVERLQRITLDAPSKEMVVEILKGMAQRYGVDNQFVNSSIFESIYEYTNRYIPSSAQPRKSILVLDSMVGWYRFKKRRLNMQLLADVIYESTGVNVAFRVDAAKIEEKLNERVFAQEYATKMIAKRLQVCVADLNDKSKPMSSLLMTGSSGVGKTEVTKQLAKILFDDERRLIRMDMSEFSQDESVERFRSELTTKVWERPYSIILLDEIEKACAPVTKLLLQVLDDGRLTDMNNRVISFCNAYIVLTTNAGSEIYQSISQYAEDDSGSGKAMRHYMKLIRESISTTTGANRFPPELLGRLDAIIPFQPLSEATLSKIVQRKLLDLMKEVRDIHGIDVRINNRVVQYLVKDNLDTKSDAGGARQAISKLESDVTAPLAAFINANPEKRYLVVDVEGKMAFEDKAMLESTARISIRPVAAMTR